MATADFLPTPVTNTKMNDLVTLTAQTLMKMLSTNNQDIFLNYLEVRTGRTQIIIMG